MDSCFTLVGAHQHGIASTVSLNDHVYYCRDGCKNTPLSASSTLHMWYLLAGNWKTVLPRRAYGDGIYKRPVYSTRAKQLSMAATARVIWLCAWVRYWPYRVWYVCFSAVTWYCFKFIWAHRPIFLIPSPYACRGRTILQFPTNSYHLFTVELALKEVLRTRRGS